jgi:uncharacterized membrane protein
MAARIILSIVLLPLLAGCQETPEDKLANAIAASPKMKAEIADLIENETVAARTPPGPVSTANKARPFRQSVTPSVQEQYAARGTEPFWSVDIVGTMAVLKRPDMPAERFVVGRTLAGDTLRYQGAGLTILVTPGPCSDGMSDTLYGDRVQIAMASGTLKGCGGDRETPDYDEQP